MKELLLDLLNFDSIHEKNDQLHAIIDYVNKYVATHAKRKIFTKHYSKNNKPSLVITNEDTLHPDILLVGHLDIVTLNNHFTKPQIKGAKIYGRGASDMKGVDAAMIQSFIETVNKAPGISLGLMLTTDEEQGGFNGVNYIVNEIGYRCNVAFVPDSADNWQICTDEKGVRHFVVEFTGQTAHSARPWNGVNAIDKTFEFYQDIKYQVRQKWGLSTSGKDWKPTVTPTVMHGGKTVNSVPKQANILLNIRFTANEPISEMDKLIAHTVAKYGGKITKMVKGNPLHIEKNNPYLARWRNLLKEKGNKAIQYMKTHASSDGRYFAEHNIPVVISKPTCSRIHREREWIDFTELTLYKDILSHWIESS